MEITSLKLVNFRNYQSLTQTFSPKTNSLVGKNAQGKTNLLEAIFFASIGKSFRTSKDKELISWQAQEARIVLNAKNRFREKQIEIILQRNQKKVVKMDGINIRRIGDVLGEVPIVFFSPDELKLVKDSPEERRRFINIDLSQTNKKYFYLISRYEKILENRNKLLKSSQNKSVVLETIDIWNKALAKEGIKIAEERRRFVEEISPFASAANAYISKGEELKIEYSGIDVESEEEYVKLAELEIIKNRLGEYPILILDDVFSELDEHRRKRLLKFTNRCQTFISTTDEQFCEGKIIKIKNGKAE